MINFSSPQTPPCRGLAAYEQLNRKCSERSRFADLLVPNRWSIRNHQEGIRIGRSSELERERNDHIWQDGPAAGAFNMRSYNRIRAAWAALLLEMLGSFLGMAQGGNE